jgi:uncharacterized protein DUF1203
MGFVVTGLSPEPFRHLYGLSDAELATQGVKRYVTQANQNYPDRIEMRIAEVGEMVLLLNHLSMDKETPYRATHAIFVREGATETYRGENELPFIMSQKPMSLRAFDEVGMMIDGDVALGDEVTEVIERFFDNPEVSYIHAHNAGRGCYSGRVDRL